MLIMFICNLTNSSLFFITCRQVFQIHDEILLEVHDDDIKAVTSKKDILEISNIQMFSKDLEQADLGVEHK